MLEHRGWDFAIVYPCGKGNFCRKAIPAGKETIAFSLGSAFHANADSDAGATCAFAVDLKQAQYLWHSEGTNGMGEPLYACPMEASVDGAECRSDMCMHFLHAHTSMLHTVRAKGNFR